MYIRVIINKGLYCFFMYYMFIWSYVNGTRKFLEYLLTGLFLLFLIERRRMFTFIAVRNRKALTKCDCDETLFFCKKKKKKSFHFSIKRWDQIGIGRETVVKSFSDMHNIIENNISHGTKCTFSQVFYKHSNDGLNTWAVVAQWYGHCTAVLEVTGSIPTLVRVELL